LAKPQLHPAEQHESHRHRDAQYDVHSPVSLHRMDYREQKKSHANAEIPPCPMLRLKSAHTPIVFRASAFILLWRTFNLALAKRWTAFRADCAADETPALEKSGRSV
jgi:hypothetical protein